MCYVRDRLVVAGLVVCVGLLLGCDRGPRLVPVTGTVLIDGEPVENASVMFTPQEGGRPASGFTDASGNFSLSTYQPGDGATAGTNLVSVTARDFTGVPPIDPATGEVPRGGPEPKWISHPRYSTPKTSGIKVEVERGMGPVTVEVTSD